MKIHQRVLRWLKGVQFVHPATLVLLVLAISLIRRYPRGLGREPSQNCTCNNCSPPSSLLKQETLYGGKLISIFETNNETNYQRRKIASTSDNTSFSSYIYFFFLLNFARYIAHTKWLTRFLTPRQRAGRAMQLILSRVSIRADIYIYVCIRESWMKTFVHNATSYSMIEIFYKFRKRNFFPHIHFRSEKFKIFNPSRSFFHAWDWSWTMLIRDKLISICKILSYFFFLNVL